MIKHANCSHLMYNLGHAFYTTSQFNPAVSSLVCGTIAIALPSRPKQCVAGRQRSQVDAYVEIIEDNIYE